MKNIKQTQHCYHSNEYLNHKKCIIFEPTTFVIYEYNIKKNLTDNEQDKIPQIVLEEIPKSVDQNSTHGKELINQMCHTLENAYYYKTSSMEISDGTIFVTIEKLINLNNMITNGSHIMLRQKQMLCWIREKKRFSWVIDVRCIRYHLKILVYAFNKRKILTEEFKSNFLKIRPFKSGNKTTVNVLLLGIKDKKKRKESKWSNSKSKILHTT